MKLWQKATTDPNSTATADSSAAASTAAKKIERFTVGRDREMDLYLAPFDVLGNLAHATMLETIGLLSSDELKVMSEELKNIYHQIEAGEFVIEEGVEDVHSQVELMLTRKLGDVGKKIHSGRSRNDQVLVDLKLFTRDRLWKVTEAVRQVFDRLIARSEQHKADLLPGYTHLQIAMPSSFGLWFGAYAEALADDMLLLQTAYRFANRNPLGSGAGYGSSFPLNRTLTTKLLGFEGMHVNVVYAQMSRGKTEQTALTALAAVAATLSRMAMDICLYNSQNFGFLTLPDALTTGSSIMPHKKNPDVAELLRAKTNRLKALPMEVTLVMSNLPSGYHRDMQILKEILMPAFEEILDCLEITDFMLENIQVKPNLMDDPKYDLMFSVERVNALVLEGVPFREAYLMVKTEVEEGTYKASRELHHTHEGSIGNLGNDQIVKHMDANMQGFGIEKVQQAVERLLAKAL